MTIKEQVRHIEKVLNSPYAKYTLLEKMKMMIEIFNDDPDYTKEAKDIVRGNLAKQLPVI